MVSKKKIRYTCFIHYNDILHVLIVKNKINRYYFGVRQDYSMSMFLRQRWNDTRLKYPEQPGLKSLELDTRMIGNIWVPDLYFLNEKKAIFHEITVPNRLMHIYPDGSVFYSMRFVFDIYSI